MSNEDRAQEIELREWERINLNRKTGKSVYQPGEPGYGSEFCVNPDCEDEMPEQRRAHGFNLCVACKQATEKSQAARQ